MNRAAAKRSEADVTLFARAGVASRERAAWSASETSRPRAAASPSSKAIAGRRVDPAKSCDAFPNFDVVDRPQNFCDLFDNGGEQIPPNSYCQSE